MDVIDLYLDTALKPEVFNRPGELKTSLEEEIRSMLNTVSVEAVSSNRSLTALSKKKSKGKRRHSKGNRRNSKSKRSKSKGNRRHSKGKRGSKKRTSK